ncbi:Ribosomal protein L11 methyltransferase [Bienertia sinuspersici]
MFLTANSLRRACVVKKGHTVGGSTKIILKLTQVSQPPTDHDNMSSQCTQERKPGIAKTKN